MLADLDAKIEGRRVPLKLTGIELHETGCDIEAVVVAVDDALAAKAGRSPQGDRVEVILGQDYLQKQHVAIRHAERGDEVVCEAAPLATLADTDD